MNNNKFFKEVNGNFAFGCMRLPLTKDGIDYEMFTKMVDYFIDHGLNYFDTARGYHSGQSEIAIKKCLTSRYPRDRYTLTDKLTENYFTDEKSIVPFFESQLEACGVEYFDFYLLHAISRTNYQHFVSSNAFKVCLELKRQGKIKHLGISFHDKADLLEEILNTYPEIEVVQLQFNYADYYSDNVQSKLNYETCVKHNKPVFVMEPIKGGGLIKVPDNIQKILDENRTCSNAAYALRFAASFPNIAVVLSGMSNLDMMIENLSFMSDFKPLSKEEMEKVLKAGNAFRNIKSIPCTTCRYCVAGCPKNILIPNLFQCYNTRKVFNDWNASFYYKSVLTLNNGKASDCIKCGKCERVCPQHLQIRELLKEVAATFENEEDDED